MNRWGMSTLLAGITQILVKPSQQRSLIFSSLIYYLKPLWQPNTISTRGWWRSFLPSRDVSFHGGATGHSSSPCYRDCLWPHWSSLTLSSKYCMNYMCWVSCPELSSADKDRCSLSCGDGLNLTPPEVRILAWSLCEWIHRREAILTESNECRPRGCTCFFFFFLNHKTWYSTSNCERTQVSVCWGQVNQEHY